MLVQDLVRRFLDRQGRLRTWPVKRQHERMVLEYLADKFESNVPYTEREINAVLAVWHTFGDPLTLRRALIDHALLYRRRDGSVYWRGDPETW